ncbi:MAG: hypothetical protein HZRFUVUK_000232 [Candidatus Fervidibacterota bacterium]|jgi:nucleotide-binding universal stress UspA family protein
MKSDRGDEAMWRHATWATDFSELSEAALEFLIPLLKRFGTKLALVHCVPNIATAYTSGELLEPLPADIPVMMNAVMRRMKEEAMEKLKAKADELKLAGIDAEPFVLEGDAHHAIIEFSRSHDTDLIVVGTKGESGIRGWFVGSTTARIVQASDRPVLSISKPSKPTYERILVPTDLSEASSSALSYAVLLAKEIGASVFVLHVMELLEAISERETLGKLEAMVKAKLQAMAEAANGLRDRMHCHALKRHHAAEGIIEFTDENEISLIVMTTHGRTGLSRFLWGSVAERIVRECGAPVIVGRAKAFELAVSRAKTQRG